MAKVFGLLIIWFAHQFYYIGLLAFRVSVSQQVCSPSFLSSILAFVKAVKGPLVLHNLLYALMA